MRTDGQTEGSTEEPLKDTKKSRKDKNNEVVVDGHGPHKDFWMSFDIREQNLGEMES